MRKEKKKEVTGRFRARTPDGRTILIIEITHYLNHGTVSDLGDVWKPHSHTHMLQNGHPVEHISGDVYQIVSTSEKVTRIP
jgi:hypothetical protein